MGLLTQSVVKFCVYYWSFTVFQKQYRNKHCESKTVGTWNYNPKPEIGMQYYVLKNDQAKFFTRCKSFDTRERA